MDYNFSYNEVFRNAENIAPAKIIAYAHGTDRGMGVQESVDFFIFHNEMQLRSITQEKLVSYDKDGVPCVAVLKNSGIECAWSGLHHFGESVALRHADKKSLKEAFFQAVGRPEYLSSPLPLAIYFEGECNEDIRVANALYKLSESCIVGVKPWYYGKYRSLPNLFVFRGPAQVAHLGRFAADVVLCGAFSGVLTTCLMLGLRIVPVYTRTVHNLRNGERRRFSTLLAKQDLLYPCKRFLDWLPALDMEDVAGLARHINDAAFWERYEKMLPALQRHVTGRFPT